MENNISAAELKDPLTIACLPAYEKVIVTNQSGVPFAIGHVSTIKDNRAFTITLAAELLSILPSYLYTQD